VPQEILSGGQEPGYQPIVETFKAETARNESIDTLFYAVAEATEEAILNALVGARDGLTGFGGRRVEGLPVERVKELLSKYRRWEV
jgi:D-aminopeptidase